MQGNSTAQHVQIQKIRASIARDIATSKRSGPTGSRKRQAQRTQPQQQHTVLRAPSGLPDAVLGETKSLVRAPGPQHTKTKVATGAVSDSKRGSFRATSNSTTAAAVTEIRDCKTSVGRLQSGRRGSNPTATGATAPTVSSRTAAVARTSSSIVSGTKAVPEGKQGGGIARSSSAPTWGVNPVPTHQQDTATKARAPAVPVQKAVASVATTTIPQQSDTCPSEEEGSDTSGDPDGTVQQQLSGHVSRQQHSELYSAVPVIPTSGCALS